MTDLCFYPSVVSTGPAPWTRRWSRCPARQRGLWPSLRWGTPQTQPTLMESLSATWTYPPVTCLVSRAWGSHQGIGTVLQILHWDHLQQKILYPLYKGVYRRRGRQQILVLHYDAVPCCILTSSLYLYDVTLTYLLFVIELNTMYCVWQDQCVHGSLRSAGQSRVQLHRQNVHDEFGNSEQSTRSLGKSQKAQT